MTPDNTVKASNNMSIYQHRIYELFDEYKDTLSDSPKDADIMIRNVRYFKGALKHIYINLFRPTSIHDDVSGRYIPSILDYNNIDLLDHLWTVYVSLCYKYGIKPTVMQYGLMTGIPSDTMHIWAAGPSGSSLGNIVGFSSQQQQYKHNIAKSWMQEQESALFDGASQGSVGDIFLLKAVYNYRDNTNITIDNNTSEDERRRIENDLIKHLTMAPDNAIQSSRGHDVINSDITMPDMDF